MHCFLHLGFQAGIIMEPSRIPRQGTGHRACHNETFRDVNYNHHERQFLAPQSVSRGDSLSFAVSTSAPGLRWAEKEFSSPMLYAIRISYCCCNRWPQFSGWKMAQTLSCCSGDSKSKRASWAEIKRWQLHLPSGVSNRLLAAFSSFSAPGSFCCLGSQWLHPGLL